MKKKKKDGEAIQESSNQFTPFRRAVCDWLFEEKAESKGSFVLVGTCRVVGPRTTQYPRVSGRPSEGSAVPCDLTVRGASG